MPAPAVIPAPKAYINAVAVKGFVVELRAAKRTSKSCPLRVVTLDLAVREHIQKQKAREWFLPDSRMSCMPGGARDFYCD